jgi:SAM-dependent methyltransferase
MPDVHTLLSIYEAENYFDTYYPERLYAAQRKLFDHRLARLEAMRGGRKGRVLDVGCGTGKFLEAALARGWEVTGLEFREETAAALKQKIPADIRAGSFPEASPFEPQSFDVVHLNHVLEHLCDPVGAITEIFRLLRPGGLFYCEVPRQSNIQTVLSNILNKGDLGAVYLPEHLYLFDKTSLTTLLQQSGFEVLSTGIEGMGTPYRYERGIHYDSLWTHLIVLVVGTLRLQGPLGGGNLAAIARKPGNAASL